MRIAFENFALTVLILGAINLQSGHPLVQNVESGCVLGSRPEDATHGIWSYFRSMYFL
jgi:hypothetical protein